MYKNVYNYMHIIFNIYYIGTLYEYISWNVIMSWYDSHRRETPDLAAEELAKLKAKPKEDYLKEENVDAWSKQQWKEVSNAFVSTFILLTKATAAQNEDALSYNSVRGLYYLAVVFVRSIIINTHVLYRYFLMYSILYSISMYNYTYSIRYVT